MLGARLHDAFGQAGAGSLFLDVNAAWRPAPDWRLAAAWRQGYTAARAGGLVARGSRLASNAWSIDLARGSVFAPGDSLALRLTQPLRVSSGGLNLELPVAYSYDTLTATNAIQRLTLSPKGREIAGELAWRGPAVERHGGGEPVLSQGSRPLRQPARRQGPGPELARRVLNGRSGRPRVRMTPQGGVESPASHRHPGLDPGSRCSQLAKESGIPGQARDDGQNDHKLR